MDYEQTRTVNNLTDGNRGNEAFKMFTEFLRSLKFLTGCQKFSRCIYSHVWDMGDSLYRPNPVGSGARKSLAKLLVKRRLYFIVKTFYDSVEGSFYFCIR